MVACQAVARGQPGSVLPTIYELLRGSAAGLLSGYRDRGVRPASSSAWQRCTSVIIQRRDRCERCPELTDPLRHRSQGAKVQVRGLR